MKIKHIRLKSIGSTNDAAKELIRSGENAPFLLTAETQTDGKGTHGRSFASPAGGLYMSIALPVDSIADSVYFTSLAAVAVATVIREHEGLDVGIKWINDVIYNGKKLCGILCEGTAAGGREYIIVGVGVNCKKTVFPKELEDVAVSYDGSDPTVLAELISDEIVSLAAEKKSVILDKYLRLCLTVGKKAVFDGRDMTALGIDADFGLILSDGEKTYVKRNAD